jgi:hypothetical protein
MGIDHEESKIDTTVGDLIVALSEAALELFEDKTTDYLLASFALEEILKKVPRQRAEIENTSGERFAQGITFH